MGIGNWNPFRDNGIIDSGLSALPGSRGDVLRLGTALSTFGASEKTRRKTLQKEHEARAEDAATAEAAPGIEMARRDAIPLMVDETAIQMARKRAMLKQAQRSGRESTMLSGGNTGGLGG